MNYLSYWECLLENKGGGIICQEKVNWKNGKKLLNSLSDSEIGVGFAVEQEDILECLEYVECV